MAPLRILDTEKPKCFVSYSRIRKLDPKACLSCKHRYKCKIEERRKKTLEYFRDIYELQ